MTRVTTLLLAIVLFCATGAAAQPLSVRFLQSAPATVQEPPPTPPPAPSLLQPAGPTFPSSVKIAFVDLQRVAQDSAAGKAASLQLKKLQDVKLLEIQAKDQALKTLQDRQAGASVLTPSAAAQLQKDLDRARMELQYTQQVAQKEVDDLQRDLMTAFSQKVTPVVEAIRAEKGLWAIWTIDETLVAAMPGLDISAEVVKRLDAQK
jgi:Skp family chaperone for outer membrane proteins